MSTSATLQFCLQKFVYMTIFINQHAFVLPFDDIIFTSNKSLLFKLFGWKYQRQLCASTIYYEKYIVYIESNKADSFCGLQN